jgi:hypothetical protein
LCELQDVLPTRIVTKERPIQSNPASVIQQIAIGQEELPMIIIDNFVADPGRLIEDAAMLSFAPIGIHYPGVRANVPPALVRSFMAGVSQTIADVFGLALPFNETECYYSIVTTRPEDLRPIQRLPHFDSTDPGRIAVLHYLSQDEGSGTSFFRHRGTGFESVNESRFAEYSAAIDADVARLGLPEAVYISGDTPMFERITRVEARFNRAVIYRGNSIHCADIPSGIPLPADPVTGRFTVNTFLHATVAD